MNKVFSEINRDNDLKRYEIKMVYDELRLGEVNSWIKAHSQLFRKAYPSRQVNNIYFDTHDMAYREAHIQGVFNRFKIRFRWYHNSWIASKGQLEIKHKYGNLGGKEIFLIDEEIDISSLSWNQIHSLIRSELDPDCQYLFDPTKPILINSYQREYYVNAFGTIRITLDTRQKCFDQFFGQRPNIYTPLPLRRNLILEIKAADSHYLEISDALKEFPLYSTAHSKYLLGTESTFF